jgi:hypothetical protein
MERFEEAGEWRERGGKVKIINSNFGPKTNDKEGEMK